MAVNKVVYGNETLIDLTSDTVTADKLSEGVTAHDKSGEVVVGTASGGIDRGIVYTSMGRDGLVLTAKVEGDLLPGMFGGISATIYDNAYHYLTSVELPEGTTSIPNYFFYNAVSLAMNNLPDLITSIGMYAFYNCQHNSLEYLPSNLKTIGEYTFLNNKDMKISSLPETITSIGQSAFSGCNKISVAKLPEELTEIAQSAFFECSELSLTSLPQNLTKIGNDAFNYCVKLYVDTISATVSNGEQAFLGCRTLGPKLKIKTGKIGTANTSSRVFGSCTGLKAVWISDIATHIYAGLVNYAPFNACTNLTDIYTNAAEKPANWGTYFNYTSASTQATFHYGVSETEFDALNIS